jgi:short-subunit dehydrogenase
MKPLAFITGASGGIGRELALRFAAGGHDLAVTARRDDELQALAAEAREKHGATVHVFPADLSKPGAARELVDALAAKNLTAEVLVNNAGFGQYGPFADADETKLAAMLQVNMVALTELTRLLLPGMLARKRGRVLNVASTAAFQPGPLMAGYYATKAYVLSLSEAISYETRGTGVTVTCLCPGPTVTGFADNAALGESKLFDGPGVGPIGPVADAGYRATMRGDRLVLPTFMNRVGTLGARFLPRGLMLRIVHNLQARKTK